LEKFFVFYLKKIAYMKMFSYICSTLKQNDMKIKEITNYQGRYCAELEDGRYILSNGSMELMECEKVPDGMKVIKAGIVGGIMMRNEDDFRWCVENCNE